MITTLSQLTETVQAAEAEGWVLYVDDDGCPLVAGKSLKEPFVAFRKGDECEAVRVAPWVDPAKMLRRARR